MCKDHFHYHFLGQNVSTCYSMTVRRLSHQPLSGWMWAMFLAKTQSGRNDLSGEESEKGKW